MTTRGMDAGLVAGLPGSGAQDHGEVCSRGYDTKLRSFTQSFGSCELDASLLLIPQTGFLPIDDPRVTNTITAIVRKLGPTQQTADGATRSGG